MSADVAIVGAGVIGLTAALKLAEAGASVTLLDRGEPGMEASWAGAGIIPPGNPAFATTPLDRLRAESSREFPAFCARLEADTGLATGYWRSGGVEFLTDAELHYRDRWHAERLEVESPTVAELADLEPGLSPPGDATAVLLPGLAQVRNPWHLRALEAACRLQGVTILTGQEVRGFERFRGRVSAVVTDAGLVLAGAFVVAAGAWAAPLLYRFHCLTPVRPVRGQMVLFAPRTPLLCRVVTVGKRYLVPRRDGRILAGSTEEPEAGFAKANTPEAVAELAAFARGLVPALGAVPVEHAWSGLRPGSADGLPSIGLVPDAENVFAAVGHFRAGIQLSVATANLVRDMVLGRPLPAHAAAFSLNRVPGVRAEPAFRS